jgi:cobalt-zinc-cadmium efflux system outer membrane protein
MKFKKNLLALVLGMGALGVSAQVVDQSAPGATVESLLALAKERNPDYGAMRHEVSAANERIVPAGALMDPRFKMELQDITKGGEQSPTLLPSNVGSTAYTLTQDLPWLGKRDLKREIASVEAEGAQGRARQTWSELSSRIKATFIQRYLIQGNQRLVGEILDLMGQLEKVAQQRYASGLAVQQDAIRAQVEQTSMRGELLTIAGEWRQSQARLNALLARPADAPLAAPTALRALPTPEQLDFAVLADRLQATNPQIFVESARVRSAEKTRDLTYKNRYPDFTLGINAMQRQGDFKEWGLMLELNLPIRDGVLRSQERESEAMLAAAQSRQDAVKNQVLGDLSDNLTGLSTARQSERLVATSLLPQAELTWRAALTSYELGKVDFATLLDAQRQIRLAKQSQLKAQAEAHMRLTEIERLMGEDL